MTPKRCRWCGSVVGSRTPPGAVTVVVAPLTVRAALADRPGQEEQDQQDGERQDAEERGRNRQLARHFGLEQRQSQVIAAA